MAPKPRLGPKIAPREQRLVLKPRPAAAAVREVSRIHVVGSTMAAAVDRISDLPDDLLHSILVRLGCAAAAARTSVLSRRWRRAWASMPELVFRQGSSSSTDDDAFTSALFPARVSAALAACAAPALRRLEIVMSRSSRCPAPAAQATSWLRFASRRVAGELRLSMMLTRDDRPAGAPATTPPAEQVLVLPPCERATDITMHLKSYHALWCRLPRRGARGFAALAALRIWMARMDSHELEEVVSSRCPRLKELVLYSVALQPGARGLSLRSTSLVSLDVSITSSDYLSAVRLHVVAPELQNLTLSAVHEAYIAAPKLAELKWNSLSYDPSRCHLEEAGRHLRRLEIAANSRTAALMQRFDTADELNMRVFIPPGAQEHESFVQSTKKLPKCKVLSVNIWITGGHSFKPIILDLLRKCCNAEVKKLMVYLGSLDEDDNNPCNSPGCRCGWVDSHEKDKILLENLEEVEVKCLSRKEERKVEFVKILSNCDAVFIKW